MKIPIIVRICGVYILLLCLYATGYAAPPEMSPAFPNYKKVMIHPEAEPIFIDPTVKYTRITIEYEYKDSVPAIEFSCKGFTTAVSFDWGASDDPTYRFTTRAGGKINTDEIDALSLWVGPDCVFYASGSSNNYFDVRRKYLATSTGLREVKQPFYLVDSICPTSSEATLRSEPCDKGAVIATIPKGTHIQILLAPRGSSSPNGNASEGGKWLGDKQSFLVRSPFGLVGWVATQVGGTAGDIHGAIPLSCIIYNGD